MDNSYKWAGGGILSTVSDLMKFGNRLLSYYHNNDSSGYLTQDTIKNYLWTKQSVPVTVRKNSSEKPLLVQPIEKSYYGLGWQLVFDNDALKRVFHTGGAVGASSCLLIVPHNDNKSQNSNDIVVAVLCNLDNASGIASFTYEIAKIFME